MILLDDFHAYFDKNSNARGINVSLFTVPIILVVQFVRRIEIAVINIVSTCIFLPVPDWEVHSFYLCEKLMVWINLVVTIPCVLKHMFSLVKKNLFAL